MIRPMNLKNIERKILDFNENLTLFDQQFIIIPYAPSGYVDYSNFGQIQGQRYIEDYETYKRVWTGNDSFIITWKDSVVFNNSQTDKNIKMTYQIGDFFAGWLENNNSDVDISQDVSFSEYKSQTIEKTLTFRINANKFNLDTYYEFMFYKVPEIFGNILFRVESLEREYLGTDLMCYVLTLKSLNQELANTGRAKQQNVMPSAPGQGFWDAKISTSIPDTPEYKEFYGRYIYPNKARQYNNPVKKVVFKAFGLCALSNIAFWGRRTRQWDRYIDFGIPEWVFPMNFTNATTHTLYRTQNEQSNYFWVRNLAPLIQFDKDAMTALKNLFSFSHVWPSEGFAVINGGKATGIDDMRNTNPAPRDREGNLTGPYPDQLFGRVEPSSHTPGTLIYKPWSFQLKKFGIQGFLTELIYGCKKYFNDEGTKVIHDVMFDAFWKQKNMKTLPINSWNTIDFGFTVGSAMTMATSGLWYGAAALIGVGMIATVAQKVLAPTFEGFSCMIPASLMDFMVNECSSVFGTNYLGKVKLSYFTSFEQDNEINKMFNTETMNTSFAAELTNLISIKNGSQRKTIRTGCIGQKKDDNGDFILDTQDYFLLDGTSKLVAIDDNKEGFIIDAIHIQGLFQGDYSIEFLDSQDEVIWSGIYQSQGKWSKSVREINTWINTSIYNRENMFIGAKIPWPKEPPDLNSLDFNIPTIVKSFGQNECGYFNKQPVGRSKAARDFFLNEWDLQELPHDKPYASFETRRTSSSTTNPRFIFRDIVVAKDYPSTIDRFVADYPILRFKCEYYGLGPMRDSNDPEIFSVPEKTVYWQKNNEYSFNTTIGGASAGRFFPAIQGFTWIGSSYMECRNSTWVINLKLSKKNGDIVLSIDAYPSYVSYWLVINQQTVHQDPASLGSGRNEFLINQPKGYMCMGMYFSKFEFVSKL